MNRVFDKSYNGLQAKWPKASMIRPVKGGFEAYVFTDPEPRKSTDTRYTQHNFIDKG